MTDGSASDTPTLLEIEDDTVNAELTEAVNGALDDKIAPSMRLKVHMRPDGRSITLDCTTGVRLSESSDEPGVAKLLLQLCASFDDENLRIGLIGEYDEVHLYTTRLSTELAAADLVTAAQSLYGRAAGVRQLVAGDPPAHAGNGNEVN